VWWVVMKVNEGTLFGVTLRTSPSHPSSVAVLDHQSQLVHLGPFYRDDDLVQLAETCRLVLIAIGSPLCLPAGLADLEPAADNDGGSSGNKGRQIDRELASMGISCFYTGRGSVIRELIYRGISVKAQLNLLGYEVVEVYPHATRVILFGDQALPKESAERLSYLTERMSPLVIGLEPYIGQLNKNGIDALMNAYTALLHMREGTDLLGNPDEGLLATPKLPH
jgi:predicted nuclease with RNAse H fold